MVGEASSRLWVHWIVYCYQDQQAECIQAKSASSCADSKFTILLLVHKQFFDPGVIFWGKTDIWRSSWMKAFQERDRRWLNSKHTCTLMFLQVCVCAWCDWEHFYNLIGYVYWLESLAFRVCFLACEITQLKSTLTVVYHRMLWLCDMCLWSTLRKVPGAWQKGQRLSCALRATAALDPVFFKVGPWHHLQ